MFSHFSNESSQIIKESGTIELEKPMTKEEMQNEVKKFNLIIEGVKEEDDEYL